MVTSGQLGVDSNGTVPDSCYEQALLCFQAIEAVLEEAEMTPSNIVRLNAFVTERKTLPPQAERAEIVSWHYIYTASTLLIVGGFTRPEFKVEVECAAVARPFTVAKPCLWVLDQPKNLAQRYVDLSLAAIIDADGERCNVGDKSNNNEFAWSSERSIAY